MVLEAFQTLHLIQKVNSKVPGMVRFLTIFGAAVKMKVYGKEQAPVK